MSDPFARILDWIDVESITGNEASYADTLARHLGALGFDVEKQEVAPGRFNLLARTGSPEVVFCTHLDTVPPWIGPSSERSVIRGRGACDAKGPAMAMIEAARILLDEGEQRVGLLFTVGEEVDSAGAAQANGALAEPWRPRKVIVGEPTENRFVRGHKGVLKACVKACGVAGHSSEPLGPSAVHGMVETLAKMVNLDLGEHPLFGRGSLNVGTVHGGVAGNVVADRAEADLVLRLVGSPDEATSALRSCLTDDVELAFTKGYGPVEFLVPEGAAGGEVVGFGTDAPFLDKWGTPLLYGPGRIRDAHTDHECLERKSFEEAIGTYAETARGLLTGAIG